MSSTRMLHLCVVTPCFNEEQIIELFYKELKVALRSLDSVYTSILFVDDGSTDRTLQILNRIAKTDPRVQVLSLSRNSGHQIALTAGLDFADADGMVMMDCDLQHPPELIPRMVQYWLQGYDVISGVRRETADASFMKRKLSGAFYVLFNFLSDVRLTSGTADFCLLSRRAHQALRCMPERHRFLRGMISWIGFPRMAVPYDAPARGAGEAKYTMAKSWRMALDAVFSFSATPIRMALRVGLWIIALAFCYLCFILYSVLFKGGTVRGWGSIATLILGLGGTQLVFVGLIGEYLSRIYEEIKDRPLYFLKQGPGLTREAISGDWCSGDRRESIASASPHEATRALAAHRS